MNTKWKLLLLIAFALSLMWIMHRSQIKKNLQKMNFCWDQETGEPQLSDWFNPKKRPDVITTTDWLAPVIWEGTYNRPVLEKYYKRLNITIGLAVICVPGKFSNQSLADFIQSANKHFLFGYNVVFYFLLDVFSTLPPIALGPLRTFKMVMCLKPRLLTRKPKEPQKSERPQTCTWRCLWTRMFFASWVEVPVDERREVKPCVFPRRRGGDR
ncbi:N-acetyllactosaminide alpha-1,3-galactosyltransferase-like 1 [Odocoileus virginianus]|uniref:N-acetyllactosaminide alpha-1,3-galactosyltransferase-like 1 n=1 Tax=Odocoileus virginianus TaxID=9874 RepID=A0ABM4IM69_ODOVR